MKHLAFLISAPLLMAADNRAVLNEGPPILRDPEAIRREYNSDHQFWIQDNACRANPQLCVGRVLVLYRDALGQCLSTNNLTTVVDEVRDNAISIDRTSSPVTLMSFVDSDVASDGAQIKLLGGVKRSSESIFRIEITDVGNYLMKIDDPARNAVEAFKTRHSGYFDPERVCAVYMAKGLTERMFRIQVFQKDEKGGNAGFLTWVVAEGKRYGSTDSVITKVAYGLTLHEMWRNPKLAELAVPQKSPIRAATPAQRPTPKKK